MIPIRTPSGWTGFSAEGGAGEAGYLIGPISKGAPYQSLAEAVAAANNESAQQPVFYCLAGGDYSADVTLPQSSTLIGVDRLVAITGQISTSGTGGEVVTVENVTFFRSAAGTCLAADYRGTGGQGTLVLKNVRWQLSGGALGLLAAACGVEGTRADFELDVATGINLTAGSAAFGVEGTELTIPELYFILDDNAGGDIGVRFEDGVGGDDVIAFVVDNLFMESHGTGTGLRLNSTPGVNLKGGLKIGTFTWVGDGAGAIAIDFVVGGSNHFIGNFIANTNADTLVASASTSLNHSLQIGNIEANGNNASTGANFDLDGRFSLFIDGGTIISSGLVFQIDDDFQGSARLSNLKILGTNGSPQIMSAATAIGASGPVSILITDCSFESDSALGPMFNMIGADNANARELGLLRCNLDFEGAVNSIVGNNFGIDLEDSSLIHDDNTVDAVVMTVSGGQTSEFSWRGHNFIQMSSGGAGRALDLAGAAAVTVREGGVLNITGCTPAEQLNLNGGGQTLVNDVGERLVAQGSIAAWVNGNCVVGSLPGPSGIPSMYPGLHVVSAMNVSMIGTAGDDSGNQVDIVNRQTTLGPAGVNLGHNPGAGAQGGGDTNFADFLLGPGQEISVQISAAGTAPTDVHLNVF